MMLPEIRLLVPGDEDLLVTVFGDVVPEWRDRLVAAPTGVTAYLADPTTFVFAALVGGEPAGLAYGSLMPYPDGRRMAYLHELDVAETFRQRGIGAMLVRAAMDWSRERGAAKFWLSTGGHNEVAQALYEHLGGDRKPLGDVNYWWTLDPTPS